MSPCCAHCGVTTPTAFLMKSLGGRAHVGRDRLTGPRVVPVAKLSGDLPVAEHEH